MLVLVNVNLTNLVRQDPLHGCLDCQAANASACVRIIDILVVGHGIVAGNDHQIGSGRWPAPEKPDAFECERMAASKVLSCDGQDHLWNAKC